MVSNMFISNPVSINHFYKEINNCGIDLFFIPIIKNNFNSRSEDLDKYFNITLLKKPIITVDMYPYNSVIGDRYSGFLYEKREMFFEYLKDLLSQKNFGLIKLCANNAHEHAFEKFNYSLENKYLLLISIQNPNLTMTTKITPDSECIRDYLLKINALVVGGDEYERDNAKRKLDLLLKKYQLTYAELIKGNVAQKVFKIENNEDCLRILSQCIWMVDANAKINYKGKKAFVMLTTEQYVEVKEKFDYFWKHYKQQKEIFLVAFVVKNKLEAKSDKQIDIPSKEIKNILVMMNGISKGTQKKQLQ